MAISKLLNILNNFLRLRAARRECEQLSLLEPDDRRQTARVRTSGISAALLWQEQVILGRIVNLSSTGAFFATSARLDLQSIRQQGPGQLVLIFQFQGE